MAGTADTSTDRHITERKRFSCKLPDGLGQILSAAKISAKLLLDQVRLAQQASESDTVPDARPETMQGDIDEIRRIFSDLRPSILNDPGLVTAIRVFSSDFELLNPDIA